MLLMTSQMQKPMHGMPAMGLRGADKCKDAWAPLGVWDHAHTAGLAMLMWHPLHLCCEVLRRPPTPLHAPCNCCCCPRTSPACSHVKAITQVGSMLTVYHMHADQGGGRGRQSRRSAQHAQLPGSLCSLGPDGCQAGCSSPGQGLRLCPQPPPFKPRRPPHAGRGQGCRQPPQPQHPSRPAAPLSCRTPPQASRRLSRATLLRPQPPLQERPRQQVLARSAPQPWLPSRPTGRSKASSCRSLRCLQPCTGVDAVLCERCAACRPPTDACPCAALHKHHLPFTLFVPAVSLSPQSACSTHLLVQPLVHIKNPQPSSAQGGLREVGAG